MSVHKNTSYIILERIKTCLFLPLSSLSKDSPEEFRDCFIVILKQYDNKYKGAFLHRPSRNPFVVRIYVLLPNKYGEREKKISQMLKEINS